MLPAAPPRSPPARLCAGAAAAANGARALLTARWALSPEALLVLLALYWAGVENRGFVAGALGPAGADDAAGWGFAAALVVGVAALHVLVLAPLAGRRVAKPVYALLIVVAALASFYTRHYGVYLDASMLRNVLHTTPSEASELIGSALVLHLALHAGVPLVVLWRAEIRQRRWRRELLVRSAVMVGALLVLAVVVVAAFQPLASAMRNDRGLRYLITPANVVWSLAQVLRTEVPQRAAARVPIGLDAAPGASWATRTKPRLVVLVVGETARAANWGLSGYARQTTPQLAALPVVNFAHVASCGTNTEVSLPCMFSPLGRRHYDERAIRGSESLLHVLARAGVGVTWRDNQSGCKGVCAGLPQQSVAEIGPPGLCDADGRCLDEGLLHELPGMLRQARGTQLLVLHPLGNHGPSYFRRYPPRHERWQPACRSDDLRRCTREEIVNAYDNALLYTDELLARLVTALQQHAATLDSALVYVSDHGESLGEGNLYLHGLPYVIAPAVQTQVPMVMWLSDGYAASSALDVACLQRRAREPASHDHLFHTLLGLLDVTTSLYEPGWDLGQACRREAPVTRVQ